MPLEERKLHMMSALCEEALVLNLRLFELKKGDSSRNKKTDPDDFSFLSQSGCRVPLAVANFQKA